jgi:dUTP pyrophosphatase
LDPGGTSLFETGLKIGVPPNYMLEIKNKSGVAFNRQLVVGACVIDSGYNGEIYINLHNVGTLAQVVKPGEKIAQAVLVPIATPEIEEIREDGVYDHTTERGTGGFGSTGNF